MIQDELAHRFRAVSNVPMPLPGCGQTAALFFKLAEVACEDLTLARLVEAHFDAVAILAEAGGKPEPGVVYAVWASEAPTSVVRLVPAGNAFKLTGSKTFCSGAGIVDRALVTTGFPHHQLVNLDLKQRPANIRFDYSSWKTEAFAGSNTATAEFMDCVVAADELVGPVRWYLERPGFWNGAISPAACWAGGAFGLVDYAMKQSRNDPHTMAHLGALRSLRWALVAYLKAAGDEIDRDPVDYTSAKIRALSVRHLVEQASTEILNRLGRAFGPHPLAMNSEVARRCQELALYLRQCHAERDLETLGSEVMKPAKKAAATPIS